MITKITLCGHLVNGQVHTCNKDVLPGSGWPDYVSVEGKGKYKRVNVVFDNPQNHYQCCDYEPTEDNATYTDVPRFALGGFNTITNHQPPQTCPLHGLTYKLEDCGQEDDKFVGVYA